MSIDFGITEEKDESLEKVNYAAMPSSSPNMFKQLVSNQPHNV